MTTYEPGTVAVATVRGQKGVRVVQTDAGAAGWVIAGAEVAAHLRQMGRPGYCVCNMIADAIEAQTKPPRIPEPGLWGVVEADANPEWRSQLSGVKRWVHIEAGWCSSDDVDTVPWATLIDPTLVREGLS